MWRKGHVPTVDQEWLGMAQFGIDELETALQNGG